MKHEKRKFHFLTRTLLAWHHYCQYYNCHTIILLHFINNLYSAWNLMNHEWKFLTSIIYWLLIFVHWQLLGGRSWRVSIETGQIVWCETFNGFHPKRWRKESGRKKISEKKPIRWFHFISIVLMFIMRTIIIVTIWNIVEEI